MKSKPIFVCCGIILFSTGCLYPKIGPHSLPRDRAAYSSGLADSWKEQMLLNIVKLRYIDPPAFVDVSSITTGYSLTQTASAGAQVNTPAGTTQENLGVGASLGYTPTITYSPLTGSAFIQGLLTPLPPTMVFGAIQNGIPADLIMLTVVTSINGLKNQQATLNGITPADPDFDRVRALIRKIQISGAVRTYVKPDPKGPATVVALRKADITPEILEDIRELRRLLKLNPDAEEFSLIQAPVSTSDSEIAMMTRSVASVMQNMAADVEVPEEDLAKTRAFPGYEKDHVVSGTQMIRIHSSKQKSPDAFVSVNYRNTWFWIDDSDLQSKQAFQQLMNLFTMADTSPRAPAPVITIPAH
ncbi:MAG TPA: hypothetical protein VJX47_00045 [Candidatus Sulfotelmatobacter sp.]|nr:hypothetical protein [Candidatus Sulfotelmatobacter sp.]